MKRIIISLAVLAFSNVSYADTPLIRNVTGTVVTGQTLTISGDNMLQEDNTNWINFFKIHPYASSFEGSSPSSDGYSALGPSGGTYVSDVNLMGNKSMRFHISGASSNCPAGNLGNYNALAANTDYYVRGYVRYNSADNTWPTAQSKTFYSFPSSGYEQLVDVWSGGGVLPTGINTYYDGLSHGDNFPSGRLENNRWYCIEAYFKGSSPAHVSVWIDGVQVRDASVTHTSSWMAFLFGIPNACGTGSAFSLYNWWDGLALSTSRIYPAARIEISNNPTYGAGTLKYQEPVYLSDGSIQIKADLSGLGIGPYYLWVTNNQQQRSAAYNFSTIPVNGACGSANGDFFSSLSSTSPNLCATGTVASFTGTGPWTWGCNGYNGGTSTSSNSCSASSLPNTSGTVLFSETFDNTSFSSRGWYDGGTTGITSSNCYTGSCAQFSFAQGATTPSSPYAGAMRKAFIATDSLYVSFYIKFAAGWRGSQRVYHPHMFYILSDLDAEYASLTANYLDTYIEFISDVGTPYAIHPVTEIQDSLRVNSTACTTLPTPCDLRAVTENRSVAYCNTPLYNNAAYGDCYSLGGGYWDSTNSWILTNSSLSTDAWHHVETYFKMNSISGGKGQTDGIMQMWIDGTQVMNNSNMIYRTNQDATKKWAQFVIAPYIGDGSPISQTMWIDELTVATSLPGTISSPSLGIISVSPN